MIDVSLIRVGRYIQIGLHALPSKTFLGFVSDDRFSGSTMFRNKNKKHDWSNDGSFMSKPKHGWLHPDDQLSPEAGICYGVRYIGSIAVLESMRALDFDTRTAITKESINRLCCAVGLKSASRKVKKGSKVDQYLSAEPNVSFACIDINLTITTESLTIVSMDSGDLVYHHLMPSISFASGGDTDTMDFVAYVAKDDGGRACHVVECGDGLAQDVITTIGQAFEIRFKNYLSQRNVPVPVPVPERMTSEVEYYNDRPECYPPSPPGPVPHRSSPGPTSQRYLSYNGKQPAELPRNYSQSSEYQHPRSNRPVSPLIDFSDQGGCAGAISSDTTNLLSQYDRSGGGVSCAHQTRFDQFDMKPFVSPAPNGSQYPTSSKNNLLPYHEPWFHGKISRQQCDDLILRDGEFLVRESPSTPGQFVLSGRQGGHIRHLLLVDPEGKVRTKDQLFNSVSHLVNYHMCNSVPIISMDSELLLVSPIFRRDM